MFGENFAFFFSVLLSNGEIKVAIILFHDAIIDTLRHFIIDHSTLVNICIYFEPDHFQIVNISHQILPVTN